MEGSERCRKKERRKADKRHKCPNCDSVFAFPNKLRNHIKSQHSQSHICEQCEKRFDRFVQLRTHMAFAHSTKHQCHLCAYSSSVKSELKKHIVANHENGVRCTIDGCNITIAYNRLKRHIQEVHCDGLKAKHSKESCAEVEQEREQRQGTPRKQNLGSTNGDLIKMTSASESTSLPSHNNNKHLDEADVIGKQGGEMSDGNDKNNNAVSSSLVPELCDNDSKQDNLGQKSNSDGADNLSTCSSTKSKASDVPSCVAICSVLESHNSGEGVNDADGGAESDSGSFGSRRGQEDSWDDEFEMIESERTKRGDGDFANGHIDTEEEELKGIVDVGIRQGAFKCHICGKHYRTHRDEKRHYRRVHERSYNECVQRKKKFVCPQDGCSRAFSLPAKLREHQACHNGEVIISCDNCQRKFKSRALYAIHLRRYHQMSVRDVNCSPHFVSLLKLKAGQRSQLESHNQNQDQNDNDEKTVNENDTGMNDKESRCSSETVKRTDKMELEQVLKNEEKQGKTEEKLLDDADVIDDSDGSYNNQKTNLDSGNSQNNMITDEEERGSNNIARVKNNEASQQ